MKSCNLAQLGPLGPLGAHVPLVPLAPLGPPAPFLLQVAQVVQVPQVVQVVQDFKSRPSSLILHTCKIARLQKQQTYLQSRPHRPASKITRLAKSWPIGDPAKIGKIDLDRQDGQNFGPKESPSFPSTM